MVIGVEIMLEIIVARWGGDYSGNSGWDYEDNFGQTMRQKISLLIGIQILIMEQIQAIQC